MSGALRPPKRFTSSGSTNFRQTTSFAQLSPKPRQGSESVHEMWRVPLYSQTVFERIDSQLLAATFSRHGSVGAPSIDQERYRFHVASSSEIDLQLPPAIGIANLNGEKKNPLEIPS
ncbi:hypothetical protein AA313_de0210352 [Arthrobotrys entomopaga]|nr:hypothetical protein AA313_de0210352 [Arthrobotrys entomopaga]